MAHDELAAHSMELLQPLGPVRSRRMFGGHGIYVDDCFVALIAFDRLYLKADEHTRAIFESAGCTPFVYDGAGKTVTVGYYTVPAEAMESPALMLPWARLAFEAALRARARKRTTRHQDGRRGTAATSKARTAAQAAQPARSSASSRGKAGARRG